MPDESTTCATCGGSGKLQHGVSCPKVAHIDTGYLHAEDDDTPYFVDGVSYCGRCHYYLGLDWRCPKCRPISEEDKLRVTDAEMRQTIATWIEDIHGWAHSKGFYHGDACRGESCPHGSGGLASALMLIVTELAEACEADRKGDRENFVEEIADTAIRLFDLCGAERIDLERAIIAKMERNRQRPHKHGKRY